MKIICSQERLLKALSVLERVVGKKESLQVLSCVLFDAKKESLLLQATNLETGVETSIPAQVKEQGRVAIPAKILTQTIKTTTDKEINISLENDTVRISSKHTNTIIKTIEKNEFPIIPKTKKGDGKQIQIQTKILIEGIQAVFYTASQSMIRPELASIYIYTDDSHLVFAATDSFRLAEKRVSMGKKIEVPDLLIPSKNASDLVHTLLSIESETVSLLNEESQLSVEGENTYFVSRVIDATFPNYKEIIPKKHTTEVIALTEDLKNTFSKARVFSNTSHQIGIHVYPKKKMFTITAQNNDVGETADTVEAALSGEDVDINFNLSYIAECLQTIHTDSVALYFNGTGKPLVIKGVGDTSFVYLVMPLNR